MNHCNVDDGNLKQNSNDESKSEILSSILSHSAEVKKTTGVNKLIFTWIITSVAMFLFMIFLYVFLIYNSASNYKNDDVLKLENGDSIDVIAEKLVDAGIANDSNSLKMILKFHYFFGKVAKYGVYKFENYVSIKKVLDVIFNGSKVVYKKIVFQEGLTSKAIVDILNAEKSLVGEISSIPAEGSLMPDTYFYVDGDNRNDILLRMSTSLEKFVEKSMLEKSELCTLNSKEDVIKLASIVEKESSKKSEREKIAYIFLNRLEKNMRLQSCPTVLYGLNKTVLSLDDLKIDTPYNTYRIDGLPKTPICNPSRESIMAVLHPEKNDNLFFIADGKGGHVFSKTFEEHKKIKRKLKRQQ